MNLLRRSLLLRHSLQFGLLLFIIVSPIHIAWSQKLEAKDRDRGVTMLRWIKDELKKNYYDPNFRGMDVDARFKTAEDKLKQATSLGQVMTIIAQALQPNEIRCFRMRRRWQEFHSIQLRQANCFPCRQRSAISKLGRRLEYFLKLSFDNFQTFATSIS